MSMQYDSKRLRRMVSTRVYRYVDKHGYETSTS
jgi:hypothetical protein